MTSMLRNLLALLVALWLAVPTTGTEGVGGENGGGTGVWILPACAGLTSSMIDPSAEPRSTFETDDMDRDLLLRTSVQMGVASATFVDEVTGTPIALDVSGHIVTVPSELLQAIAQTSERAGSLIVSDASLRGYLITIEVTSSGKIGVRVY